MNHSLNAFADDFLPAFEAGDSTHATKSLEAENVACVQAFYRAVAQGNYEAVRAYLAPDIAFEILGGQALPSIGASGIDEVMAQIQANFAAVASDEAVIETMVAQGDMLMAVARNRGHFRANGAPYHLQLIMHYTFQNGRIWRFRQWLLPLAEDSTAV
ncbi:MAG: nuclear transport factor 2 family protein [Armatimonas sp.]